MSRARSIKLPNGETKWFNTTATATAEQLELLATYETDCDLEELLEAEIPQKEVVRRLRIALGHNPIPPEIIERRQKWRTERSHAPRCRICGKYGDSTKHHFINKWILKELRHYQQRWSNRRDNCIPLCIDCHQRVHTRDDSPKSIVHLLSAKERQFAEDALSALAEEHPRVLVLLARGDDSVYQTRLVRDWIEGKFRNGSIQEKEESNVRAISQSCQFPHAEAVREYQG